MDIERYVDELTFKALDAGPSIQPDVDGSMEYALKGRAIELWLTTAGGLFLVADEADARHAMERFGACRGEVYTATEVRRIVAVNDPAVVAEIHEWKRRFDGIVRESHVRMQPR